MATLHSFIGEATHEDSLDGLNEYIIISADIPEEIKAETMEEISDDAIIQIMTRAEMDSLTKSIDEHRDYHSVADGYILDLTMSYILGFDN